MSFLIFHITNFEINSTNYLAILFPSASSQKPFPFIYFSKFQPKPNFQDFIAKSVLIDHRTKSINQSTFALKQKIINGHILHHIPIIRKNNPKITMTYGFNHHTWEIMEQICNCFWIYPLKTYEIFFQLSILYKGINIELWCSMNWLVRNYCKDLFPFNMSLIARKSWNYYQIEWSQWRTCEECWEIGDFAMCFNLRRHNWKHF